jgi:hypothetical protein
MTEQQTPGPTNIKPHLGNCPRCGGVLAEVDGWVEYGDRMVAITAIGCWECGYHEELEHEDSQADETRPAL